MACIVILEVTAKKSTGLQLVGRALDYAPTLRELPGVATAAW